MFPHSEITTFGRYVLLGALRPGNHLLSPLPQSLVQRLQLLHVHRHTLVFTNLLLDLFNLSRDGWRLPQTLHDALQALKDLVDLVMKLRARQWGHCPAACNISFS